MNILSIAPSETLDRAEAAADFLAERSMESENQRRIGDEVASKLREIGVVRMLQPQEYGGEEAHPVEFMRTVLEIGSRHSGAGWVAGVVGVHPWQIAQCDPKLQSEIWGSDIDTWVASPYAPLGKARRVEGGYVFNGRWPFSSGTDECDWVILGGTIVGADGRPEGVRHFVLPRADYTIHHDTWEVAGLAGSGSKDVSVHDAFVPDYRVYSVDAFQRGQRAREVEGRDIPLYRVPFSSIFPAAINTATLAMCEGALASYIEYTRQRKFRTPDGGIKETKADPHHLHVLGEAAADIDAGRTILFSDWERMVDAVAEPGSFVSDEMRIVTRRSQVRAVRRAVDAVDRLFAIAGGGSLQLTNPIQRFWRDTHAGMVHICSVADPVYQSYGRITFGQEPLPVGW